MLRQAHLRRGYELRAHQCRGSPSIALRGAFRVCRGASCMPLRWGPFGFARPIGSGPRTHNEHSRGRARLGFGGVGGLVSAVVARPGKSPPTISSAEISPFWFSSRKLKRLSAYGPQLVYCQAHCSHSLQDSGLRGSLREVELDIERQGEGGAEGLRVAA